MMVWNAYTMACLGSVWTSAQPLPAPPTTVPFPFGGEAEGPKDLDVPWIDPEKVRGE